MNAAMFSALAPILILSLTAIVLMTQASIKRDQSIASMITGVGFVLALFAAHYARDFAQPSPDPNPTLTPTLTLTPALTLTLTPALVPTPTSTLTLARTLPSPNSTQP